MIAECIVYREQLLIVAGVIVVVTQQLIAWIERRYYRRVLRGFRNETEGDIHSIDRS